MPEFKAPHKGLILATCQPGREDAAETEILDCLLPHDHEAEASKTNFQGVILVHTTLNPVEAAELLRRCPMAYVHSIVPFQVYVETSLQNIVDAALKLVHGKLKPNTTFAVRCRRRGRLVKSSTDVEKTVGAAVT
ncbi:hypothetical protein DRO02_07265, partial [archaeon]